MHLSAELIDHAVAALRDILHFSEPADVAISRYFRAYPKLGLNDRAFIAEAVFAILRRKLSLEHAAGQSTPRKLVLAYLVRMQGMNQRELQPATTDNQPLAVQADLPEWLTEKLQGNMSDVDLLALARGMQQGAPLDLRVNTLRANREEVLSAFERSGIAATPTPYSPLGIRIKEKPALNRHPLFLEGRIEVQDEASQLACLLVAPRRGEMVVDFCAGAGGKTLGLGALMASQGRLYAFDVSEKRLNNLKPRLKRSGLSNLHPQLISNENDAKIKRLHGKIDRVLVDAPCTGLGTLRRNPDLKWRQSLSAVGELAQKQSSILAAAAKLVKSGGRLVYATCSILPEENEQVVEAFLAAHPQFQLVDAAAVLAQQHISLNTGMYLRLLPHLHGTDGFFAAVMEKQPQQGSTSEPPAAA
jgi:16S rRNA (cytosine967-C5)-methyltransferase